MYFLNIGGTMRVALNEILSYSAPDSATIKRIINKAKEEDRVINVTGHKATRSVIFTKEGYIYLSPFRPERLDKRTQTLITDTLEDEDS